MSRNIYGSDLKLDLPSPFKSADFWHVSNNDDNDDDNNKNDNDNNNNNNNKNDNNNDNIIDINKSNIKIIKSEYNSHDKIANILGYT
ncbi:hypothetical protein C1645_882059 [Glomus cerebriforme]|uniref:Uncharacterized protein n=1 Tax=Glomus cerebriforme TaxID=658196 RepID=A0A397S791_9GLOM|nr:hypothetical protein C1645_882059 [Glomus cerebriforme]